MFVGWTLGSLPRSATRQLLTLKKITKHLWASFLSLK